LIEIFENFDKQYIVIKNSLDAARIKHLELEYEIDIERDPLTGYRRVCEYLNLQPETPRVSLQKIGTKKIIR
jgi:hypothetical protein